MLGTFGLLEEFLVSEEGLYSMDLITLQYTINVIWRFNGVRTSAITWNITIGNFRALSISHFRISAPIYVATTGRQIS